MRQLEKAIVMTTMAGGLVLSGFATEAQACGLGSTDFKVVKTNSLNVRTEPNTKTGVVKRKLKLGDIVRPQELSENKAWGRIGKNEWVSMSYLEMIDNHVEEDTMEPTAYIINTDSLNIRKQPNANAEKVGEFLRGTKVFAMKKSGVWLYAGDGHNEGWIHGGYVVKAGTQNNTQNSTTPQKPTASIKEETVTMRELKVKVDSANIRKGPGMDYPVVGYMKKGATKTTKTASGNWYKVDGGWIHNNCVNTTILSMNSNATDELWDAPAGDEDMTRTVTVPEGLALNVRYTKALGGSVKDKLPQGKNVTVISEYSNGVSYIKYINSKNELTFGYVASRYLK